jgi:hypothetical protein
MDVCCVQIPYMFKEMTSTVHFMAIESQIHSERRLQLFYSISVTEKKLFSQFLFLLSENERKSIALATYLNALMEFDRQVREEL